MIFDQYQRYKTVEIIVNIVRERLQKNRLTILEIGSNAECNLEKVLPNDEIQYSDIELSDEMKKNERFIQLDGCNMSELSDGQYDIVIALDVLEHVPGENRERFMSEMNRVAGCLAILCFPYKTVYNESAERRVNDYYRMIYGTDHKWLIEHIENGLPQIDVLTQILLSNGISFCEFYHGDVFVWEEMMKGLFTVYELRHGGDYFEQIDKLYEEQIYFNDNTDMSYRAFMLLSKDEGIVQHVDAKIREQYADTVSEKVRTLLFRCIDDIKYRLISEQGRRVRIKHQIYYADNDTFDENNKFVCISEGLNPNCVYIDQTVKISKEYRALRFDPIEGEYCILKNLTVESNRGDLSIKVVNGTCSNNEIMFCVEDPQIYIDLSDKEGVEWIRIHGEMLRTEFPEAVLRYPLNRKLDSVTDNLIQRVNISDEQQTEIKSLITEYLQKQNEMNLELIELNKCNEFLDSKIKQCEDIQLDLSNALEREETIREEKEEWRKKSGYWEEQSRHWEEESRNWEQQKEHWQERCAKMERTISWRITGILRKLGKIFGKA